MRITGPPGRLRRGVGLRPTSPSGLSKNSLRKYTPTWGKSNEHGRAGLVNVNRALSASTWNWLRWVCRSREAR
jgi:hypothetical protein